MHSALARLQHIKGPEFVALTKTNKQFLHLASQNWATFRDTANIMD